MRLSTKLHERYLNEAFPESSLALVAFLKRKNRRGKKIPGWRVRQIQNLVKALNATAFELERAFHERRRATLAWSARNFLELSVWVHYCCTSEQNAKRFKEDTSRDMFGLVAAGKKGNLTPEQHRTADELLQRLERIFNTPTFKVTDEFKRVANAAAELGREAEFLSLNKLFSKMAHPTAFAVNSRRTKPFDKRFEAALFIQGVNLALKSMVTLIDFFMTNFPDANLKRKVNALRP